MLPKRTHTTSCNRSPDLTCRGDVCACWAVALGQLPSALLVHHEQRGLLLYRPICRMGLACRLPAILQVCPKWAVVGRKGIGCLSDSATLDVEVLQTMRACFLESTEKQHKIVHNSLLQRHLLCISLLISYLECLKPGYVVLAIKTKMTSQATTDYHIVSTRNKVVCASTD